MADAMVSSGMKDAGYQYINIDDCWMAQQRDQNGDLQADPERFPHGIKYLADYVHSKGLKLGIYSSNGLETCQSLPASLGNEKRDAKKFAQWGVDFLKYDFCCNFPLTNAPDIDKITVSNGSFSLSSEAESKDNSVTGSASVVNAPECSGGKKVGYISGDGKLTFNKITVPENGSYKISVTYSNGIIATPFFVSVNGGAGTEYMVPVAGAPHTVSQYTFDAKLQKGENQIAFYNNLTNQESAMLQYQTMSNALLSTKRPIVFNICEWGDNKPWLWAQGIGNMWRIAPDISDSYTSMLKIFDLDSTLQKYAGPGSWNDPDSLEVGNGGMSETEYCTHFSLWCIEAAPLITGNDLSSMTAATKQIVLNKDAIAVDQDSLGIQGSQLVKDVYVKPLSNGDKAVLFLNRSTSPVKMSITLAKLGFAGGSHTVKNLWSHTTNAAGASIEAVVAGHGVAMFRVHQVTILDRLLSPAGIILLSIVLLAVALLLFVMACKKKLRKI